MRQYLLVTLKTKTKKTKVCKEIKICVLENKEERYTSVGRRPSRRRPSGLTYSISAAPQPRARSKNYTDKGERGRGNVWVRGFTWVLQDQKFFNGLLARSVSDLQREKRQYVLIFCIFTFILTFQKMFFHPFIVSFTIKSILNSLLI